MRDTYTSKPTSKRSTYTFCRIFGIFSTSILFYIKMLLDAQIKECNTKISTTPNTYDESQNNTNATPTAPQLPGLHHSHPLAHTNTTNSRPNYVQSPIHHIVKQQSQNADTYEQIIEQPHTSTFQSQNNQFFSSR